MDEVEKILKDNNYFTNLEKRIEEYNNKMMAVYNNEATEYINRVNKAIEFLENNGEEITYSYYQSRELLDKLLNILNGDYEV